VNGTEGNEDMSICVGSIVRSASTLFDAGKPETSAAATTTYAVARGLLSQLKDSSKVLDISANTRDNVHRQPSVNTSSNWSNPSVSRSSSSSADDLINNPPLTEDVKGLRPTHVSGIGTPSFPVLAIANQQHTSPCVTTTVSEASPVLKYSTQNSVFPNNNSNSNCATVAVQSLLAVSGELASSPEITPDDLPALLCSFLFGSPDSITSCDTVVTTLEEDPQTKCKNGSMDFMLSSLSSDTTQLQSHDKEARSYEILGVSPSKIEAESAVSVSGYEISAGDGEKQDDEVGSEVQEERHIEQCVEDISASSTSTTPKKACRTRTRCRVSGRTSGHVKKVQRGISVESGYHTSSENHVKLGIKTPSSQEKDKTGNRDDDDDDDDADDDDDDKDSMNERLVLVPSGE
jgi:hypothetical protein